MSQRELRLKRFEFAAIQLLELLYRM
jgi:hypothetical protein